MSAADTINRLHRLYCDRTGYEIGLNYTRQRQWWEWLQWRPEKPFSQDDLLRVIAHIRRGIFKGERNDGALKFTNLIGSPDRFEEDLGLAIKSLQPASPKPKRAAVLPEPPPPSETMTPDEFEALRREMGIATRRTQEP